MRFRYEQEHEVLRTAVREFLADVSPEESVRREMESDRGWSPEVWRRVCAELELPALAVPEACGGGGFGLVELGIVLAEAGRSLLCAPLLSTCLAGQALRLLSCGEELRELATGAVTGTLAFREPGRAWDAVPRTRAECTPGGWRLTGTKEWVLDGNTAGRIVASARAGEDPALFLVRSDSAGLKVEAVETIDATRRVARVTFDAVPAELLATDAGGTVRQVMDVAAVLLAAEQVGVAERCLDSAVEHARRRTQFGRPIGSFQAVKHMLAGVLLELEAARAAALYAAFAADRARDDIAESAAVAAYTCSEAALLAAGENVQVHGGIGMTWEHSAHLYLRRATVSRALFGHPQDHLERLVAVALPSRRPSGGTHA